RRPPAADPPWLRDPLDDPPRLGLAQGQARGPVRQAKRLADLALRQRLLASHEVAVHTGDRGSDPPGRAHVAPCLGQPKADLLGDGGAGRWSGLPLERDGHDENAASESAGTCALTLAHFRCNNVLANS